jgi:hypothetical protein
VLAGFYQLGVAMYCETFIDEFNQTLLLVMAEYGRILISGVAVTGHSLLFSIEAKRLPDFAGRKLCVSYHPSVIAAGAISGIAIAAPPTDQVW